MFRRSNAVSLLVACSLMLLASGGRASLGAQGVAVPDTPAGHLLRLWLDAFNSGDSTRITAFEQQHKTVPNPAGEIGFRRQTGGFDLLTVERSEASHVEFMVKEHDSPTTAYGILDLSANDPAKIKAAQDALSMRIRAARVNAKHGDVFTSEITAVFRRLLYPELRGDDGRDAKAIIKDDAPTNIPFKVNAKYPEGASVPTVPANLLINLPTLPEPLQFRIIDKHLILLDEDADVIVDYALNVIR